MGTPIPPSVPVLMTALVPLTQWTQAGKLPNVAAGQPFWARSTQVQMLISVGQARLWRAGDPPAPQAEPAHTAAWTPGIGAGTSNSSY